MVARLRLGARSSRSVWTSWDRFGEEPFVTDEPNCRPPYVEYEQRLHAVSAKYTLRSFESGTLDLDW